MKKYRSNLFQLVIALALAVFIVSGCSHSTSKQTSSVIREEPLLEENKPVGRTVIVEKTETITEKDESCGGVLSCLIDGIGAVIAFPFKAVGYIITAIF